MSQKGGRKRHSDSNENDENRAPKKKSQGVEGIAKSQLLLQRTRTTRSSSSRKKGPRVCGNGRPMPSLAELEKMFEDSDEDEETAKTPVRNAFPERYVTPEKKPHNITEDKLMSPSTLKQIAIKLMDRIEKHPSLILENPCVLEEGPPPPVKPPRKRKKSDTSYIVGCKDRPQVPWQPKKTIFCKGDAKYGADSNSSNSNEDEKIPKKHQKRSQKVNLTKSIFNAESDEIAATLKNAETLERLNNDSPDSNETVEYDFTSNSPSEIPRSFSPLPSTSKDEDTILKNDKLFNESLCNENSQNDVEIIEQSCDIINIDDTRPNRNIQVFESDADDDCCIIVTSDDTIKRNTMSPIKIDSPKDDIYGSIDLTNIDSDICEVIDVDDVIAENKAIIKKYESNTNSDNVTLVEPSTSYTPQQSVQNTSKSTIVNNSINSENLPDVIIVTDSNNVSTLSRKSNRNNTEADVVHSFDNSSSSTTDLLGNIQHVMYNHFRSFLSTFDLRCSTSSCPNYDPSTRRRLNMSVTRNDTPISQESRNQNIDPNVDAPLANENYMHIDQRPVNNVPINMIPVNNVPVNPVSSVPASITNTNTAFAGQKQHYTDDMKKGIDCPICMDSLIGKATASTLCGHIFCMSCIKAAIRANGKKCPTCRKALKGVGYHQIFL